jgi:hypothetical protein
MAWWGRSEVIIDGESISIETEPVTFTGIEVGDRYVAQRNRGIQLLTCRLIHPDGWLEAEEPSYSYDLHECFRVKTGE